VKRAKPSPTPSQSEKSTLAEQALARPQGQRVARLIVLQTAQKSRHDGVASVAQETIEDRFEPFVESAEIVNRRR